MDIAERTSDEIVRLVAEDVADLGIVVGTVDTGRLETYSLPAEPLRRGVPLAHLMVGRDAVAFAEVLAHGLVSLNRTSALTRFPAN